MTSDYSFSEGMTPENLFLGFINDLEGFKTRCKNLHWAAAHKNIHEYLDDFLSVISDFQDGLAEDYMGILGLMPPTAVNGKPCDCADPMLFIEVVKEKTIAFYENIPEQTIYNGISSECETFIHNINKYKYLFTLCN